MERLSASVVELFSSSALDRARQRGSECPLRYGQLSRSAAAGPCPAAPSAAGSPAPSGRRPAAGRRRAQRPAPGPPPPGGGGPPAGRRRARPPAPRPPRPAGGGGAALPAPIVVGEAQDAV